MRRSRLVMSAVLVLAVAFASQAYGQGTTTSSISGTVVDSTGGVLPGATVVVKNKESGQITEAVTNSQGAFSVPGLPPAQYSVTVTLQGFKSASYADIRLAVGVPVDIPVKLEVGDLKDVIEVKKTTDLVNTRTATVQSTLNSDQINKMPVLTRNLVNAVTFLPGVNTATINRDSTFNGLPNSFVAISFDGVNDNENYNKSTEGLFAMITPRPDAVEAVTVTLAGNGADVGGHGAVAINFVTRSGTNRYAGSAYDYWRNPKFNSNYYFNDILGLPKNDIRLKQYGFREGGPIVIPGMYDGRGKAFFFVNYEELRLPNNFTRTRVVAKPQAYLTGLYEWSVTVNGVPTTRTQNVLTLAAQNNQLSAINPLVASIFDRITKATATTGVLQDVGNTNTLNYVWLSPGFQIERQPVVKFDYNLTPKHRLSVTYNWQLVDRDPDHLNGADIRFPGATNYRHYQSYRPLSSGSLRSTLSNSLVNELTGGMKWGPSYFGRVASNGPQTYVDLNGYAIALGDISSGAALTNWHTENGPSARSAWSWNLDEKLSWQHKSHSLTLGGSGYFGNVWVINQMMVPSVSFGVAAADPANGLFTTANFPGASTDDLNNAKQLYATLTGRVISYGGQVALAPDGQTYVYLGPRKQEGRMNEYSAYVQDSWRMHPTITLNGGVRWDILTPFSPKNDIMTQVSTASACGISGIGADGNCNFFQFGNTSGVKPVFDQFGHGSYGWKTDWNNLSPNVGISWRPNVQHGFGRAILGDPDQATLRAGFSVAYDRQGMQVFASQYGANPGSIVSVTKNENLGNLLQPGTSWPVLLTETNRLFHDPVSAPVFPLQVRAARADSLNGFRSDIKGAYARSYNVGLQRALSRDMAVEVRYVGTRGIHQWTNEDWNETNIIENGFFKEFQLAMANLQSNIANGRGNTFAYFGPGTNTNPLPIYLAYFNGVNASQAGDASKYTGANWTNTTFVGRLSVQNPSPTSAANDLDGNSTRRGNAATAGLPANFFVLNPDVSSVNMYVSDAFSTYDALQIEVRRRLSRGLQVNGSYQFASEAGSSNQGKHFGRVLNPTGTVRHAIKMQWDYSVPVGRGRRFGANLPGWLDGVVGGWEFNGVGRIQARTLNFGNVRLVGMTKEDLQKMYFYRTDPDTHVVTLLPADVILNTRRAFNVSATLPGGYSDLGAPTGQYIAPANSPDCIQLRAGDCAPRTLLIRAPWFSEIDMSLAKKFFPRSRVNFQIQVDIFDVFKSINFNPVANPGSGGSIFQVTSAYQDISNQFYPGSRVGQLTFRVNW